MKIIINGKMVTFSVHDRPNGNATIKFRVGDSREQFTASSGVRKRSKVTVSVATEAIEAWFSRQPQEPPKPAETGPSLDKEIASFIDEEYQYTVPEHRTGVRVVLQEMAALVPTNQLGDITKEMFRSTIKPTMEGRVKPHTWANKLSYIRKFLRWEVERENILRDPTIGVKPPPKESFGTHEDIWEDKWYSAIRAKLGEIREVGKTLQNILDDRWFTGMDTKDLWQLQPRKHLLRVTVDDNHGRPRDIWKVYKKRAKESEIIDQPIHKEILDRWIKRWDACGPDDILHPNHFESAKTWGKWFLDHVHDAQRELGLPLLDAKSIRHTFATRWAKLYVTSRGRKGPPLEELRKWMGHAPGSRILEKIYVKWGTWVSHEDYAEAA